MLIAWEAGLPEMGCCVYFKLTGDIPFVTNLGSHSQRSFCYTGGDVRGGQDTPRNLYGDLREPRV